MHQIRVTTLSRKLASSNPWSLQALPIPMCRQKRMGWPCLSQWDMEWEHESSTTSSTSSSIGRDGTNPSTSTGRVLIPQCELLLRHTRGAVRGSRCPLLSFPPTTVLKSLGFEVIMPWTSIGSFLEQSTNNSAVLPHLAKVGFQFFSIFCLFFFMSTRRADNVMNFLWFY